METSKHFKKREAILACLRATREHPSAEAIFEKLKPEFPDLSLGTVYRNLTLFKQQGLITSLGAVAGVERFDANTHPHVHFVCTACGRVEDLPGLQLPQELCQAAAAASGGRVADWQLTFSGTCSGCCSTTNS